MTRAEYNAHLQEMQRMGFEVRTVPERTDGRITSASFQVWWSGQWHALGLTMRPFSDDATFTWDEHRAIVLQAEFAHSLATS